LQEAGAREKVRHILKERIVNSDIPERLHQEPERFVISESGGGIHEAPRKESLEEIIAIVGVAAVVFRQINYEALLSCRETLLEERGSVLTESKGLAGLSSLKGRDGQNSNIIDLLVIQEISRN
jgi:hypothetical protein